MADAKLTALAALANVLPTDLGYIVSNPGGTPISKKVLVSQLFAINLAGVTNPVGLTVGDTGSSTPRGIMSWQSSTDAGSAHLHLRKSRGTFGTPTVVVANDILGRIVYSGYDGASFLEMGSIRVTAVGTIASTRIPTKMEFMTATDAAPSVLTVALTIDQTQKSSFAGQILQTSASATAFESGPNGATNPVLRLVNSTASQATGLSITGNATGTTVDLTALDSGSNAGIKILPKGTGNIVLGITDTTTSLVAFAGTGSGNVALRSNAGVLEVVNGANNAFKSFKASSLTTSADVVFASAGIRNSGTDEFTFQNTGFTTYADVIVRNIKMSGVLKFSSTAPTIAAGFGTTPVVAGTATSFTITIGTGGTDSTGTITLPAAATGWIVQLTDITNNASFVTSQTGGSTTTATVQNYSRTTGLPIAWTAGDVLRCTAVAY